MLTSNGTFALAVLLAAGLVVALTGSGAVVSWVLAERHTAARLRQLRVQLAGAQYEATHDPLTRLLNRRGFCALAGPLVAQAGRHPLVLIMADLHGLKQTNDVHGHGVGDLALRSAAALIQGAFGSDALVARLGGDEFAILVFGETPYVEASVSRLPVDLGAGITSNPGVEITAGFGAVAVDQPCDLGTAFRRADCALYRAKATDADVNHLIVFSPSLDQVWESSPYDGFRLRDVRRQPIPEIAHAT